MLCGLLALRAVSGTTTSLSNVKKPFADAHTPIRFQATAGSPIHLVLLGEIAESPTEFKALVRDIDPREGDICEDMRSKPLIATLSHSVLARSGYDLYGRGIDAVMSKPLTSASLHVLLDFAAIDEAPSSSSV